MQQYKIYLPNGECVSAGAAARCAIARVQLTKSVNVETELMPGGVCSTMLEVTIIDPEGLLTVSAGDWLRLEERGSTLGLFRAESRSAAAAASTASPPTTR